MNYRDMIEKLRKPCPECSQGEVVIVGLPPKPGSTMRYEPEGYEPEPCSLCGAPPVHIRIKGLNDKPRNDEDFAL